ncbi:hypothetical protein [Kribbella sp. VKM Ac-2568]|uniref:hypothetical protein n=1 Tax=Kribbella sp. VKM Ac-2568 TaxID=2512219 RepID=UPI00104C5A01|nr:hypothetical protein [Kribbella sp. VKM Ac-2568]TCM46883.1 hypothetical protein EV648_105361 [Kribbella sp. VKM Ac-2568]
MLALSSDSAVVEDAFGWARKQALGWVQTAPTRGSGTSPARRRRRGSSGQPNPRRRRPPGQQDNSQHGESNLEKENC